MLVHNEHIVEEQPACGETLCSVEEFKDLWKAHEQFKASLKAAEDNFRQLASLNSVAFLVHSSVIVKVV